MSTVGKEEVESGKESTRVLCFINYLETDGATEVYYLVTSDKHIYSWAPPVYHTNYGTMLAELSMNILLPVG